MWVYQEQQKPSRTVCRGRFPGTSGTGACARVLCPLWRKRSRRNRSLKRPRRRRRFQNAPCPMPAGTVSCWREPICSELFLPGRCPLCAAPESWKRWGITSTVGASFAANTAAEVVGLFRTEFLTTSGALVVLLLLGLSAIGSLPIFFLCDALRDRGRDAFLPTACGSELESAGRFYCIASGVPTALAAGCLCLFGASALQVSGKIQRCSFGKAFHSTGAWGLVGQFAQTLFLLLPICGAATGMLYLCGQMKLSF